MAKPDRDQVEFEPLIAQINAALEASDIALFCAAVGEAVMLHNVSEIARQAGLKRTSLYRVFGDKQCHPNFSTVLSVLEALGLQLKVVRSPKRRSRLARGNDPKKL